MKRQINLVVGFTPYQSLYAESFIDSLVGDTYFFFTKREPKCKAKRIGFPGWPKISFIVYIFYLRFLFLRGVHINFYFPHACHPATNYLVFSGKCKSLHVFEEGIANYHDAYREKWVVSKIKKNFLFFIGLPYHDYSGHITGCDEVFFDSCICSFPNNLVNLHRFKKVVFKKPIIEESVVCRNASKVLFLDQPLIMSISEREALNKKLSQAMSSYDQVFYKGHHDQNKPFGEFLMLSDAEMKIPAELLVATIDFGVVVSFNSSALITIKSLFPEVECLSFPVPGQELLVRGRKIKFHDFLDAFIDKRYN